MAASREYLHDATISFVHEIINYQQCSLGTIKIVHVRYAFDKTNVRNICKLVLVYSITPDNFLRRWRNDFRCIFNEFQREIWLSARCWTTNNSGKWMLQFAKAWWWMNTNYKDNTLLYYLKMITWLKSRLYTFVFRKYLQVFLVDAIIYRLFL